ncbi:MAG TPA: ATP-dependent 6-phosphofructokinase [bacterium]|nr:ATP-dependent 6-phosphofructokinase [bacterium]HMY36175.1 ATP-dependent 6-phosphofructokinase [bacterium]HMZ03458.1 ATP-dependent 6-phosphofructokinase [bacterium]HNB08015.1 ATP-dependent 6-phosphofructokinase [bacterium]HNB55351.1 ATP-dependent 6-phosphofructokinase [bacterium]
MKRIGVLTGGGDVPGLNPCIKALVYDAIHAGMEVVGIRSGWGGLLRYNPDDPEGSKKWITPLDLINTRTIDRSGGTFLHTSRTNPGKVNKSDVPDFLKKPEHDTLDSKTKIDFTPHIFRVLKHLKIDALVTIGGDDTLSYSVRLHNEDFPVVAIPKTMDNDVYGTDYCIGFSTAVTRSVHFINMLRTPAGSHERIAVVELFGRNSGETSLISALLANADRAIISEVPFDPEKLSEMLLNDKRNNPSNYAIMTISEGATMEGGKIIEYGQEDAYGHKKLGGIGEITAEAIKKITGQHMIYQSLAYLMRSGEPDALDRMVAMNFAGLAIDLLTKNRFGMMTALQDGRYTTVPAETIIQGKRNVDVKELYDVENYRPKVFNVMHKPMFLY